MKQPLFVTTLIIAVLFVGVKPIHGIFIIHLFKMHITISCHLIKKLLYSIYYYLFGCPFTASTINPLMSCAPEYFGAILHPHTVAETDLEESGGLW